MRRIEGNLYRLTDQSTGRVWFVECVNEMQLMEYIAYEFQGVPLSAVFISKDGKTPKVAIYSNVYYKDLNRKRR